MKLVVSVLEGGELLSFSSNTSSIDLDASLVAGLVLNQQSQANRKGYNRELALCNCSATCSVNKSNDVFFIHCRNGYHGTSPGTLGVLAHSTWKLNVPVNFGFFQVCGQ